MSETTTLPYKFQDLRTYSSTEWLADSRKNYRTVFSQAETAFIYVECACYNKSFDQEEWQADLHLAAYALENDTIKNEPLCEMTVPLIGQRQMPIIYAREGWGSDEPGKFWKEGTYVWRASVDGEVIGESHFFVYDTPAVSPGNNPFFDLDAVRLFESNAGAGVDESRRYFTTFEAKGTRFIFAELTMNNNLARDWMCEMVFNFYNEARQLKGKTVELFPVKGEDDTFRIASGWGSDFRGTWFIGNYTVEIVFMDTLVAVIPFRIDNEFVEGIPEVSQGVVQFELPPPMAKPGVDVSTMSLDEVLSDLEGLVGLREIKNRMREYARFLQFLNIRKEKGLEEALDVNLHAVFLGNPGTGKTTVARQLGRIYRKLNLLSSGHVHEVDRADLVGEYIGHTAPRVREAILQARGGILFIDEAYALARGKDDGKDFGREVVELLVKEMSNGPGDIAIVVAGYPAEMETFLTSNPGLKSRFTNRFLFDDYLPEELTEIAAYAAEKRQVTLDDQAQKALHSHLINAYRDRDRTFGNARYVFSMIDEAKLNLGLRIMKHDAPEELEIEALSHIQGADIEEIFTRRSKRKLDLPIDEVLLKQSIDQLNELVGLHEVKNDVNELVKLVRFYRKTKRNVLKKFSLHAVFVGNPGTGKTTVAHLLGQVYKALGILERGQVVLAERADLVGKFVGETAPKTEAVVKKAQGSVLFIDEAYTLAQGGPNDFGQEAIDSLLSHMETMRGEMAVIVAGYPKNMKHFLESNPGLKSRFDRKFTFADYVAEDLMEIWRRMLNQDGIVPDADAAEHMLAYFAYLYQYRNAFFGNARAVRRIVVQCLHQQHLRLADSATMAHTDMELRTLKLVDVAQFKPGDTSLLDTGKEGKFGF